MAKPGKCPGSAAWWGVPEQRAKFLKQRGRQAYFTIYAGSHAAQREGCKEAEGTFRSLRHLTILSNRR